MSAETIKIGGEYDAAADFSTGPGLTVESESVILLKNRVAFLFSIWR